MARVTVEDCCEVVSNRFQLVALAAQRVKQYHKGAKPVIALDNDKNTVIALREIANSCVDIEALKNAAIKELQNYMLEDDDDDILAEEDTYDPVAELNAENDSIIDDGETAEFMKSEAKNDVVVDGELNIEEDLDESEEDI